MIKKIVPIVMSCFVVYNLQAQNSNGQSQRLDFARMYFEVGGNFFPSFNGKQLINEEITTVKHSPTLNPYITWGGFHFWGHTEFYVTFPLNQINLNGNEAEHALRHSVATGARFYPWAVENKKVRPYIGINWGTLSFTQMPQGDESFPTISKDFMLNFDVGVMYSSKKLAYRLGFNYFPNNEWQYPLSKTEKSEILTPSYAIQLGLLYSFDFTKNNKPENRDKWNSYPMVSKLSYDTKSFGDFFLGAGPSQSFSLSNSEYNAEQFPYLQQKLTSSGYIDLALGYHFNKWNLFSALSYRNPKYTNEGFGTQQTIHKNSIAFEVNKFLTDYSGFSPYLGFNIAFDQIRYTETVNAIMIHENSSSLEPGLTFGWDIVPGKTSEALILRTNLRWYPFASFQVKGAPFNFTQLEYNLIQLVFYPSRLKRKIKVNESLP